MPAEAPPDSKAYLLDTTHCSSILKGAPEIRSRLNQLNDILIFTCVICRGELVYMAEKSQRAEENRLRVDSFLQTVDVLDVDQDTADIYGRIKSDLSRHYGPKDAVKQGKFNVLTLGFSDNDLWIAAVAVRYGLTLVSGDSDFERIQKVMPLQLENWRPAAATETTPSS